MKEAKSEAENIIAAYKAEMEASYQAKLSKVHSKKSYVIIKKNIIIKWSETV